MKKRMILLLAAASIAASNPVITFAVVPDRVVGVGRSITVDEGDIVEINCSDLKHAGIYSLSEYDHDISKQMRFSDLEFFRLFRAIHEAIDRFTILSSLNLIPAGLQRLEMEQAKRNQNKENGMSPGYGQYAS